MTGRFQFSLEKLLLVTAWAAIICVVGPPLMRWGGVPRKHWLIVGLTAWLVAIRIVPGIFKVVRAYHRFRDSEL